MVLLLIEVSAGLFLRKEFSHLSCLVSKPGDRIFFPLPRKEKKAPAPTITASLAEHPAERVPEHIFLIPPAFWLFAEGNEIIHHQQKFKNSPFSGESFSLPDTLILLFA